MRAKSDMNGKKMVHMSGSRWNNGMLIVERGRSGASRFGAKGVLAAGLAASLVAATLGFGVPMKALADNPEYTAEGATSFVFSDSAITATEGTYTGYSTDGTALEITGSGTYIVSGTCKDGSITVKKGTTGVTLVLNGLTLTNVGTETTATAPLACNKSTGVEIVVASGTTNTLADSKYNNDETYTGNENAENAVIKCKDGSQVTLRGSGTLTVNANAKNGIKSGTTDSKTDAENPRDASLTIQDVALTINATEAASDDLSHDGINAEQTLNVKSGTLNITAGDDALHCDSVLNIGADGTVGPTIAVSACYEGIEAATVNIASGDLNVNATDDVVNAANSDLGETGDFSVLISGGKLYGYSSEGDGIDSNGSLTITGGDVQMWTASTADNQPLDAGATGALSITGGTVLAAGGSSGSEPISVIEGSQGYVAFGGSMGGGQGGGTQPGGQGGDQPGQQGGDQSTPPEKPEGDQQGQGTLQGDQSGQQNNQGDQSGQGAQPGQPGPGGQSTFNIAKGATLSVQDAETATLQSATTPCAVSYVFLSSAAVQDGESYTLCSNGQSVATATAGESGSPEPEPIPGTECSFTRLSGTDRYATGAAIAKEFVGAGTCETVILATGETYPDALCASAVAGLEGAPIVITKATSLPASTAAQLQSLGAEQLIVMGGTAAVSNEVVESACEYLGIDNDEDHVVRYAGDNRYETALEAYLESGLRSDTCIVATGLKYADALSVSPYAYATETPIFLAGEDGLLTDEVAETLAGSFDKVIIVGGTAVVDDAVADQLGAEEVVRLSGSERYATSLAIASWEMGDDATAAFEPETELGASSLAVATGEDYPDALCGSALCGKNASVLLLTSDANYSGSVKFVAENKDAVAKPYIFGGENAVSADIATLLNNALKAS